MNEVKTTRNVVCSFQADPEKIEAYLRSKNPEIAVNENLLRVYARAVVGIAGGHLDRMSDEELLVAMSICKVPVMSPAEFLKANDTKGTEANVSGTGAAAGENEAPEPVRSDNGGVQN